MKRELLLGKLKKLEPAISTKEFTPVYTCFCFSEQTVHTYNDVIGMEMGYGGDGDFIPPIRGGIRGRLLLDYLNASTAPEVDFITLDGKPADSTSTGEIQLKVGRSKLKMALIAESEFVFKFPEADSSHTLDITRDVVKKLSKVLPSMGHNPGTPWQCGITIFFRKKGGVSFYATNNQTCSQVRVDLETPEEIRGTSTIMSPPFCELLIDISSRDEPLKLVVTQDWVEARFRSGLRLFSKVVGGASVDEYLSLFSTVNQQSSDSVEIPAGFGEAIDRALVLTGGSDDSFTDFAVKNGVLKMKTTSRNGEADDELDLKDHPDFSAKCNSAYIKKLLEGPTYLKFIEGTCLVLQGDGLSHIVTLVGEDPNT